MKISSTKIKVNDLPDDFRDITEPLGDILNPFISSVVLALNKNLTVDDNLPFEFKTIDIEVDGSGYPLMNNTLQTSLKGLKGYICINASPISSTGSYPTACPFLSIEVLSSSIKIRHIAGLQSGVKYRLVLMGIS